MYGSLSSTPQNKTLFPLLMGLEAIVCGCVSAMCVRAIDRDGGPWTWQEVYTQIPLHG